MHHILTDLAWRCKGSNQKGLRLEERGKTRLAHAAILNSRTATQQLSILQDAGCASLQHIEGKRAGKLGEDTPSQAAGMSLRSPVCTQTGESPQLLACFHCACHLAGY
jgi:hypothetical protein